MGLFSLLSTLDGEVVSHDGNQAVLRVFRRVRPEHDYRVRLHGSNRTVRVRVHSLEQESPTSFVCRCTLVHPDRMPSQEKRAYPRRSVDLVVTSRELPGEKGRALDLSPTGIRLGVSDSLPRGELIGLMVEEISVVARVCWCRPVDGCFLLGLQFERMDKADRARLQSLLTTLEG